jgi:hypothetical protein
MVRTSRLHAYGSQPPNNLKGCLIRNCYFDKVQYACGHICFVPGARHVIHADDCQGFPIDELCFGAISLPTYPAVPEPCPKCLPEDQAVLEIKEALSRRLARWIVRAMKALDVSKTQYWTWNHNPLIFSGEGNLDLLKAMGEEFTLCILEEIYHRTEKLARTCRKTVDDEADSLNRYEIIDKPHLLSMVDSVKMYEAIEEGRDLRYELEVVENRKSVAQSSGLTKVQIFDNFNGLLEDEALRQDMEDFDVGHLPAGLSKEHPYSHHTSSTVLFEGSPPLQLENVLRSIY